MSREKDLFRKIQELKEDDFSRNIVIPLLEKMGFSFVDFNGGPYEQGKDIIATKKDDFGGMHVVVVQSKKLKTQKTTKSSQKFGEIAHQLRLCQAKKIPCIDGIKRIPSQVLLVTPFKVDTRHIEEQFETLEIKGIKIIDEIALLGLLERFWPDIFEVILGESDKAARISDDEFRNVELFRALSIELKTSYSDYYSDLAFFVGDVDSRSIFSGYIELNKQYDGGFDKEEWSIIRRIDGLLRPCIGVGIVREGVKAVENKFDSEYARYRADENKELILLKEKYVRENEKAKIELSKNIKDIIYHIDSELVRYDDREVVEDDKYNNLKSLQSELDSALKIMPDEPLMSAIFEKIKTLHVNEFCSERIKKSIIGVCDFSCEMEAKSASFYDVEKKIIPYPKYEASILEGEARDKLNIRIREISASIKKLNDRKISSNEIRFILDDVNLVLRCVDGVLKCSVSKSLDIRFVKGLESKEGPLDISAHAVFDSGCNIAIYGEAGAGKSTTLHVYAERLYKNKRNDEEVLFIPLNRVTSKLNKLDSDSKHLAIDGMDSFDALINAYLLYKDVPCSVENRTSFVKLLSEKRKVVVIFDALDEAADHSGWIVSAISEIPRRLARSQVIVSSRDCVRSIKEIKFLGITLLPFSENQLKRFIYGWIRDDSRSSRLWDSIRERELFEVAKNPLLATIICSLHESGIDLPENESQVYEKKIELLCGLYDQYKGVKRTKSDKSLLEKACRKIAFHMHLRQQREATLHEIREFIQIGFEGRLPNQKVDEVLVDLIGHCNILVFQVDNDTYGFGHLRIQEFLAADEMSRTRSIDLIGLISKDWWSGALYLYSFSNDIQPLIDDVYEKYGNFRMHRKNLKIMIGARPKEVRRLLLELLERHEEMDRFDSYGPLEFGFDRATYESDDASLRDDLSHLLGPNEASY